MCWLESKSADTDSISHAYQNLCMTEQCKEEPANSAITSKPSIQNSPISSRLLFNVLLDVDRLNMTLDGKIVCFVSIGYNTKHLIVFYYRRLHLDELQISDTNCKTRRKTLFIK